MIRYSILSAGVLFVTFTAHAAIAQFAPVHAMARSVALASSNIATPRNALDANAALALDSASEHASTDEVELLYVPNPAGLEQAFEIGLSAIYSIAPSSMLGFGYDRLQYSSVYSAQDLSMQFGHRFVLAPDQGVVTGVRLHYATQDFSATYLPANEIVLDVGATIDAGRQVSFGVAINNLLVPYNSESVSLSRTTLLGMGYAPISDFNLDAAIEIPDGAPVFGRFGAEYLLEHFVYLRAGIQTATGEISGGVGLHAENFELNFGLVRHPVLSNTLTFSLGYKL